MNNVRYSIPDAKKHINLPAIVFNMNNESVNTNITLELNKFNEGYGIINSILKYVVNPSVGVDAPELKDVVLITDRVGKFRFLGIDVRFILIDELMKDFNFIVDDDISLSSESLINTFDKYGTKLIILDTIQHVSHDLISIKSCLNSISDLVIELVIKEDEFAIDLMKSEVFDNSESKKDLLNWLLIFNNKTLKPKELYKRYINSCTKVYSFKYFKYILKEFNSHVTIE